MALPLSSISLLAILAGITLVAWFIFGGPIFQVGPDEEGVVQTFGKHISSVGPGLHFKWPWPVQKAQMPKVTEVKRIEIGFRTIHQGPPAIYQDASNNMDMLREAQMLTGDENIVNSSMIIQYQIKNAADYLFNVKDQEETLRDLAEACERQVIGDRPIDDVLTIGKTEIQVSIAEKIQELADKYSLGIRVIAVQLQDVQPPQQVAQAFKDVATAKEDKSRLINAALGYRNEKLPKARGEVAKVLRESEAYKQARIARAQGDAARFSALYEEYVKAPEVTHERLYLETMRKVLPRASKVIIDEKAGVLNINDLTQLLKKNP